MAEQKKFKIKPKRNPRYEPPKLNTDLEIKKQQNLPPRKYQIDAREKAKTDYNINIKRPDIKSQQKYEASETKTKFNSNLHSPSSLDKLEISAKGLTKSFLRKKRIKTNIIAALVILLCFGFIVLLIYSISSMFSNSVSMLTGENIDPYMAALYNEIEDTAKSYKVKYGVDIDRHLLVATLMALKDQGDLSNNLPARSFISSLFQGEEGKKLSDYSVTFIGNNFMRKVKASFADSFASTNEIVGNSFPDMVDKIISAENSSALNHHLVIVLDKSIKLSVEDFDRLMAGITPNHQIFINTMPGGEDNTKVIREVAFKYKNINIVDFAYYSRSDEALYKDGKITESGERKASEVYKNALSGETEKSGATRVATLSNKKLKGYIELLAKYQIMIRTTCEFDSSDYRKIASNDDDGGFKIFSTEAAKEKNYNCGNYDVPEYEVSTEKGFKDDPKSGSVYYWNLMDETFISEEYYNEYFDVYSTEAAIFEEKARLVDYIYEYADVLRQTVPVPKGLIESQELGFSGGSTMGGVAANGGNINISCDSINVRGFGNIELEKYVEGVLSRELSPGYAQGLAGGSLSQVKEGLKAFSIMIRTFGIHQTKECRNSISATTNDQVYGHTSDAVIKDIVSSTKGMVLTKNGKLFSTQYDSYYCQTSNCSGDTCSCSYTYLPNETKHNVGIPLSYAKKSYGGHGRGASQVAIIYFSAQGKKAEEIIPLFYQQDVKISKIGE